MINSKIGLVTRAHPGKEETTDRLGSQVNFWKSQHSLKEVSPKMWVSDQNLIGENLASFPGHLIPIPLTMQTEVP